ncbi:MAG: trypsin-like serine protease [Kofleriaceae bacterium]|jgi:hypothetical protein|nr:trypsin-like serine protease [Kofleriaceae bacterium]MBP6838861.1 trypsin-like serine protease [Kofleriaceae bacterium]MBP9204098.1 trypsin-like serine protease [Kofleriaceae bacterium]
MRTTFRTAFLSLLTTSAGLAACAVDTRSIERPVIGGAPTPAGQYPGIGALMLASQPPGMQVSCTGTLIAPDVVLTAAHCVDPLFIGNEVPGFTLDHTPHMGTPAVVAGSRTVAHPMFDLESDPGTGPGTWYDIALLVLATPITSVEPIALPGPAEAALLDAGDVVDLVGYGRTSNATFDYGVKFNAQAPIVATSAGELQISNPGDPQNCNGDSGGPALIELGGLQRVVGVVSRSALSSECTDGGIDTRVDHYLAWIEEQAPQVCTPPEPGCGVAPPDAAPPDAAPPAPGSDAGIGGGGDGDGDGGGCCSSGRTGAGGRLVLALGVGLVLAARRRRRRPRA